MRRRLLFAAVLLAAPGAFADVGLINHLAGEAVYTNGRNTAPAKAFMTVRDGDRITLASGAQVSVVYFEGGRRESYTGPAMFTAGLRESTVQNGAQPQVSTLPSGVPQTISQAPELIQIARLGRSGGVASRAAGRDSRLTPQQHAEVRHARQTYEELRQSAAADDITPELYLYSVFQDHLLYQDMKVVVSEMARRQPENPDVAVLVDYVKVRTEAK